MSVTHIHHNSSSSLTELPHNGGREADNEQEPGVVPRQRAEGHEHGGGCGETVVDIRSETTQERRRKEGRRRQGVVPGQRAEGHEHGGGCVVSIVEIVVRTHNVAISRQLVPITITPSHPQPCHNRPHSHPYTHLPRR
jgi:hypothetical protein